MSDMNSIAPSIIPSSSSEQQSEQQSIYGAKRQALLPIIHRGANWFYWIAGLTAVNTFLAMTDAGRRFLAGLTITQIVDAVASEMGSTGHAAGIVIDVFFIGFFILFGVFANREKMWALLAGLILFSIDTALLFLNIDLFSLAIHGIALYSIFNAYRSLRELEASMPPPTRQGF